MAACLPIGLVIVEFLWSIFSTVQHYGNGLELEDRQRIITKRETVLTEGKPANGDGASVVCSGGLLFDPQTESTPRLYRLSIVAAVHYDIEQGHCRGVGGSYYDAGRGVQKIC
ncbi:hypothetical protein CEXT_496401 [Caerostris extrusa]|uniref:Secreted protein n=1 Tax=Caerostris extrusa TaxID=172846 RepID=A0AAV4NSR3_CAEEX|nr:hypothetical protein CEXT_496401 [Caerostris extrusa]